MCIKSHQPVSDTGLFIAKCVAMYILIVVDLLIQKVIDWNI